MEAVVSVLTSRKSLYTQVVAIPKVKETDEDTFYPYAITVPDDAVTRVREDLGREIDIINKIIIGDLIPVKDENLVGQQSIRKGIFKVEKTLPIKKLSDEYTKELESFVGKISIEKSEYSLDDLVLRLSNYLSTIATSSLRLSATPVMIVPEDEEEGYLVNLVQVLTLLYEDINNPIPLTILFFDDYKLPTIWVDYVPRNEFLKYLTRGANMRKNVEIFETAYYNVA